LEEQGLSIIGIWKFTGGIIQERLKERSRRDTEVELEYVKHESRIREGQLGKLAESQFHICLRLWECLQGLKLAVDAAWEEASQDNVLLLAQQLRATQTQVNK
jgi:hypothetical protein